MNPARGMLLVKPVETAQSLPDGNILLTERTRQDLTSHQMEVLAVGYPAQCLTFPDCERPQLAALSAPVGAFPGEPHFHPCDAKVGDWVLVAHRSLSETDTDGIFICSQDAVIARLCA